MKDISKNYVQIQGWMISKLNLSGNELIAYALIYGFSQDQESEFTGSINYLCTWLSVSRPTAIKVLKSLSNKNLIQKSQITVNNVTFNKYKISLGVVNKLYGGSKETLLGGSKETLPNNTNIYNTNNKDMPTLEDFKNYALEKSKEKNIDLDIQKLELKYESWKESGWKDGHNKLIKNWKSKILNTIPYLKSENKTQNFIDTENKHLNKVAIKELDYNNFEDKYKPCLYLVKKLYNFHVKRHKSLGSLTEDLINKKTEDYYYHIENLLKKYEPKKIDKVINYISIDADYVYNKYSKSLSIDVGSFERNFARINQEAIKDKFGQAGKL